MAKQQATTDRHPRELASTKIARDLIRMARVVSGHMGGSIQDVIDQHLRPGLTKAAQKAVAEMARAGG